MYIKPKKTLGQHFLKDENIAKKIVGGLSGESYQNILEIGPGMGVLTKYLLSGKRFHTRVVEIDKEAIAYLEDKFPELGEDLIKGDFLTLDLPEICPEPTGIIGNFPYNISSQIFFHILRYKDHIPEVVCMIQKEVAERIKEKPGSKKYGILSVFLQAYYQIEYLFTVNPGVFAPPPKVQSAVIRLQRNNRKYLDCDERFFKEIVKTGFNQRRKTLRNSLKKYLNQEIANQEILGKRPEQLSIDDFVALTKLLQ